MPTGPKDSQKPAARPASPQTSAGASRQERLAQALRDNLKKRKAQQRAQAQKRQEEQDRQEGQGGRAAAAPNGGQEGEGGDAS